MKSRRAFVWCTHWTLLLPLNKDTAAWLHIIGYLSKDLIWYDVISSNFILLGFFVKDAKKWLSILIMIAIQPWPPFHFIALQWGENSKKAESVREKFVWSWLMFSLKLLILTQTTSARELPILLGENMTILATFF